MPRRDRKSKKRAAQPIQEEEEEDGWYTVRGILDERKVKGKTEYLVDWDDNPKTGEPYPSSWVRVFVSCKCANGSNCLIDSVGVS